GHETWLADNGGRLMAAISILGPSAKNENPVLNLGRNIFRPESYSDGSGEALLKKLNDLAEQNSRMAVVRVLASENQQQILFENVGFACVGFQPFKHMHRAREGVLFYVKV